MADHDPRSEPDVPTGDGPSPMTDDDLLTLIGEYERKALGSEVAAGAAIGATGSEATKTLNSLEIDRYNALNAYFARPFGNETETSSQVVWPELRDTVEWIVPELARVFLAAKTPCVFDPEGPDDVDQAQEETEAVNHVFMRQNAGFFVVHDYMKDALLLRNGYVRVEAEQTTETSEETYSGMTEDQLTQLMSEKDAEVIGQNEQTVMVPPPLDAPPGSPSQPAQVFDVKLRIKRTVKKIIVEALPPEEMRIAAGTRDMNLDNCSFVEHLTKRTRSKLIIEGFDPELVNTAAAVPDDWFEMDAIARNQTVDQLQLDQDTSDWAQQELKVRNVTIHCDFDGDGVAERRQVVVIGNKIASNEMVEECPIASGVPKRMPHRHNGISMYDELLDIQVIKSELMRQGLNGLRLANNPRIGVDWKNCSLSDLMTWRSGGVIRTNGNPQGVLFPFQTPSNITSQVLPMMEAMDQARAMRTGIGAHTMGLDADELQDVTKGAQLAAMSAASLKVEMVARMLAEGLKDVFLKIHALLIRHQDVPMKLQIGGQWKEVDPRKWRKRTRVSPNVGLGSGNREEARSNLAFLMKMQEMANPLGLVGPKQAYNTAKMGVQLLGYDHAESYFMDPSGQEFAQAQAQKAQQPPDPKVQAAQINAKVAEDKIKADQVKAQAEERTEQIRAQAEVTHEALQSREDRHVQMAQTDAKMFTDLAKILAQIVAGQLKNDAQADAGAVLRRDVQSLEGK